MKKELLENCLILDEGLFISAKDKKAVIDNQKAIANFCKSYPLLKDYKVDTLKIISISEYSTVVAIDGHETDNVISVDKLKGISERFNKISSKYNVRVSAVFKVKNKLCRGITVHSYPSKKFEYKDNL